MAETDATAVAESADDFELVYICNPEVHGDDASKRPTPGRVSRLWLRTNADKGWVECDENGDVVTAEPGKPLSRMTKPELLAEAQRRGISVDPEATNAVIAAAIEAGA